MKWSKDEEQRFADEVNQYPAYCHDWDAISMAMQSHFQPNPPRTYTPSLVKSKFSRMLNTNDPRLNEPTRNKRPAKKERKAHIKKEGKADAKMDRKAVAPVAPLGRGLYHYQGGELVGYNGLSVPEARPPPGMTHDEAAASFKPPTGDDIWVAAGHTGSEDDEVGAVGEDSDHQAGMEIGYYQQARVRKEMRDRQRKLKLRQQTRMSNPAQLSMRSRIGHPSPLSSQPRVRNESQYNMQYQLSNPYEYNIHFAIRNTAQSNMQTQFNSPYQYNSPYQLSMQPSTAVRNAASLPRQTQTPPVPSGSAAEVSGAFAVTNPSNAIGSGQYDYDPALEDLSCFMNETPEPQAEEDNIDPALGGEEKDDEKIYEQTEVAFGGGAQVDETQPLFDGIEVDDEQDKEDEPVAANNFEVMGVDEYLRARIAHVILRQATAGEGITQPEWEMHLQYLYMVPPGYEDETTETGERDVQGAWAKYQKYRPSS